ncbi:unnamed protein product [Fructobacillus fructosus]|uniref:Uncharacterized protein n=1 Tax=Fructobacillus fructosus TaxID=1631 RepID=A0ABN9YJF2_9LACO|nr:unnamed protein product [Fructobacillus fructosus]CAK1233207.1 unnamed protein product [Fructobacillus fructosus]
MSNFNDVVRVTIPTFSDEQLDSILENHSVDEVMKALGYEETLIDNDYKNKISKKLLSCCFESDNFLEKTSHTTKISIYDLYSIINYNYKFIEDKTFKKLFLYLDC